MLDYIRIYIFEAIFHSYQGWVNWAALEKWNMIIWIGIIRLKCDIGLFYWIIFGGRFCTDFNNVQKFISFIFSRMSFYYKNSFWRKLHLHIVLTFTSNDVIRDSLNKCFKRAYCTMKGAMHLSIFHNGFQLHIFNDISYTLTSCITRDSYKFFLTMRLLHWKLPQELFAIDFCLHSDDLQALNFSY